MSRWTEVGMAVSIGAAIGVASVLGVVASRPSVASLVRSVRAESTKTIQLDAHNWSIELDGRANPFQTTMSVRDETYGVRLLDYWSDGELDEVCTEELTSDEESSKPVCRLPTGVERQWFYNAVPDEFLIERKIRYQT